MSGSESLLVFITFVYTLYMYCCWRSNYLETDGVLEKEMYNK